MGSGKCRMRRWLIAQATACPALPLIAMGISIRWRVLVPQRAMRYGFSLCGSSLLPAFRTKSAFCVDLGCNRFKMIRINTSPMGTAIADPANFRVVTGVVERQSCWYCAFEKFVGDSMRTLFAEDGISAFSCSSGPFPATVRQFIDVVKKQVSDLAWFWPCASALARSGTEALRGFVSTELRRACLALPDTLGSSHSIPSESFRSGLRGAANAVAARSYFTANRGELA